MHTSLVTAVRPSKPRFLIEGVVPENAQTIITGGSVLQRECLLTDMAFSLAFDSKFHGRNISKNVYELELFYVGNSCKVSRFLWAWGLARENSADDIRLHCVSPGTFDELHLWLSSRVFAGAVLFIESVSFPDQDGTYSRQLTALVRSRQEQGSEITCIMCAEVDASNKATIAKADTHIHLSHEDDETVLIEVVRNALNDYPTRFLLSKTSIDGVLVYQNSHVLDHAMRVIFEVRRGGKKQKLRVIDVISAVHCCPSWPTDDVLAKVLGVTVPDITRVLAKLQSLKYLDLETCSLTDRGVDAIRTYNPDILIRF
jgi:hypothetical protein